MKLGRFAILMIGIFVAVVALSWGFFMKYIPNKKEKDLLDANTQLNNDEAAKMGAANQRVAKAKKLVDQKGREWSEIVATRTPPSTLKEGGIDLSVDAWQLSVDYPKFRDSIQKAVNAQVKKGGVTVVSAPEVTLQTDVPANQILSAVFNYPALPGKFPIVMYDFGTITVQGTYKQIMDNVRAYKNMPHYLAVADGLRLDGTSPNLTGTYSLSIVGFIRAKTIAPPVNEGVATASSGGAGGLFGGPGGGMTGPGGPGGLGGPRNPGGRGGGAGRAGGRGPVSAGTGGGD